MITQQLRIQRTFKHPGVPVLLGTIDDLPYVFVPVEKRPQSTREFPRVEIPRRNNLYQEYYRMPLEMHQWSKHCGIAGALVRWILCTWLYWINTFLGAHELTVNYRCGMLIMCYHEVWTEIILKRHQIIMSVRIFPVQLRRSLKDCCTFCARKFKTTARIGNESPTCFRN